MFKLARFVVVVGLLLLLNSDLSRAQNGLPTQTQDLSVNPPVCAPGSKCNELSVESLDGAEYRGDYKTWSLADTSGKGITFKLNLPTQMPVVWKMDIAAAIVQGKPNCAFSIMVNQKLIVENYADTTDGFHPVQFEFSASALNQGENTITIALEEFATTQLFVKAVTVSSFAEPENLVSAAGKLRAELFAQFGIASITGTTNAKGGPVDDKEIWSRAYGVNRPEDDPRNPGQWLPSLELIPGPSFVYKPGDLFQVYFENQLNKTKNAWLKSYEDSISSNNPGDIPVHVTHEINIPHDGDNTNLHVHGLHVDPRRDNVLLLIIPEDDDPEEYSEDLQADIPNLKSNSGGNGKYWTWQYSYKIPPDHMPGTHWYHAHKHGATSTQVANGMAGAMMIRPNDDANTFSPGLWNPDPYKTHDRIMVLQEIANYGVQQGKGIADVQDKQPNQRGQTPDITVNGLNQPTLQLQPGQIERWRFVNAGSNHRTSSYFWLGKKTGATDSWGVPIYENAVPAGANADSDQTPQMYLVAIDGVTLNQPQKITASQPAVAGAGNRCDFMIRIPDRGEYAIFKNYPVNPVKGSVNQKGKPVPQAYFGGVTGEPSPGNLQIDQFNLGTDYQSFLKPWPAEVTESGQLKGDVNATQPIAPLLSAQSNGNLVQIRMTPDTTKFEGIGWQPVKHAGGGAIDNQLLAFVDTRLQTESPENGSIPENLSKINLSPFSPTGSGTNLTYLENGQPKQGKPPSYAAPISDQQIDIPPVSMVFDQGGPVFLYDQETTMQQFTLNGRQFNLNDFVGNPDAANLIQMPIPRNEYVGTNGGKPLGSYNYAGRGVWTNEISGLDSTAFWTNPGYFVPIKEVTENGTTYYNYDYSNQNLKPPTYQQITGLDQPSQPVAQSAQEWILINNSSIFHPFHIHISPFFVTEVGQLHYDGKSWGTRYIYAPPADANGNPLTGTPIQRQPYETQVTDSAFQYVVGNWWDVMMIPPHGYVKFRTWINVPRQSPGPDDTGATEFTVEEDTDSSASWVFHCHILRHEDRGMMMILKTKKKNPGQSN